MAIGKKIRAKMRQGVGKIRRYVFGKFRKRYVEGQLALRQGECKRCGACCKLLFHCPFLEEMANGLTRCKIHAKRPTNCRLFPIDESDLRDRDSRSPHTLCGYHFGRSYRPFP